ncbi:MAG: PorT family protein, partial [Cyclobacteriaceae bacterium]|nr:PorT family protein [Cyclobacteriaceae bacterium]
MKTKIKWIMLVITLTLPVSVMGQVIISLLLGDKLNSGKIEFGLDGGVNYSSMKGLSSGGFTSY